MLCNSEDNGCEWIGTVETLKCHTEECGFAWVQCPNNCASESSDKSLGDHKLLRNQLEDHLQQSCPKREYSCNNCGVIDTYTFITEAHDEQCEKKVVDCSNKLCDMRMERGLIKEHVRKSCDFTVVYCKYASIGCEEKKLRKEIKMHEDDDKFHFKIALNHILDLRKSTVKKSCFTFKLNGYREKKDNKVCHYFQPFFSSQYGYKLCFFVYPNGCGKREGTHLSVFVKLLHGPYDNNLSWPLKGVFKVELLNQLTDSKHRSYSITFDSEKTYCQPGGVGLGSIDFIDVSKLSYSAQTNTQYLVDNVLYFRLTLNIPSHKPWLDHTHE